MLNFHGFGGSASDYMQEADMRSLAEADTFILIYPQGSCLDGSISLERLSIRRRQ